jgi:hypothetical protein
MPHDPRSMEAPFLFAHFGVAQDSIKIPSMSMERCLPTLRTSYDVVAKTRAQLALGNTRGGTKTYSMGDLIMDEIRFDIKLKQRNAQYLKRPNWRTVKQTTCLAEVEAKMAEWRRIQSLAADQEDPTLKITKDGKCSLKTKDAGEERVKKLSHQDPEKREWMNEKVDKLQPFNKPARLRMQLKTLDDDMEDMELLKMEKEAQASGAYAQETLDALFELLGKVVKHKGVYFADFDDDALEEWIERLKGRRAPTLAKAKILVRKDPEYEDAFVRHAISAYNKDVFTQEQFEELLSQTFLVNLNGKNVKDIGIEILRNRLIEDIQVKRLHLQHNGISLEGSLCLRNLLEVNNTLEDLDLSRNYLADEGAREIAEAMKINTNLTTLNLGNNNIEHEGLVWLCDAMNFNGTLTELDIAGNSAQKSWLSEHLKEQLARNTTFKSVADSEPELYSIDFSGDPRMRENGATLITPALIRADALTTLDLTNCAIPGHEMEIFAQAFGEGGNASITWLSLADNCIGDSGAVALASALECNSTLTSLELRGNGIADKGGAAIARLLLGSQRRGMYSEDDDELDRWEEEDEEDYEYTDEDEDEEGKRADEDGGVRSIAEGSGEGVPAEANERHVAAPVLAYLGLAFNNLGMSSGRLIGRALSEATPALGLTSLDMRHNKLHSAGLVAIGRGIANGGVPLGVSSSSWNCSAGGTSTGCPLLVEFKSGACGNTSDMRLESAIADNIVRNRSQHLIDRIADNDPSLKTVEMSCIGAGPTTAASVASALKNNSVVMELKFAHNCIGDEGATSIVAVMQMHPSVMKLELENNFVSPEAQIRLVPQLKALAKRASEESGAGTEAEELARFFGGASAARGVKKAARAMATKLPAI